jgi:hypothetical protein
LLKLSYRDRFWTGGGYRQAFGNSVFLGAAVNEMLAFSYFFTFASGDQQQQINSQEVVLRVRPFKDQRPER